MERLGAMQLQLVAVEEAFGHVKLSEEEHAKLKSSFREACTDLVSRPDTRKRLNDRASENLRTFIQARDTPSSTSDASRAHNAHGADQSPSCSGQFVDAEAELQEIVRYPGMFEKRCSSSGYRSVRRTSWFGILTLLSEASSAHQPSCELHMTQKRKQRYNAIISHPNFWDLVGISTTLDITRGAGASVITRSSVCARVVSDGHESFKLLEEIRMWWRQEPTLRKPRNIVSLRKGLDQMLRSGRACPGDVSESGVTLLEVSYGVGNAMQSAISLSSTNVEVDID